MNASEPFWVSLAFFTGCLHFAPVLGQIRLLTQRAVGMMLVREQSTHRIQCANPIK